MLHSMIPTGSSSAVEQACKRLAKQISADVLLMAVPALGETSLYGEQRGSMLVNFALYAFVLHEHAGGETALLSAVRRAAAVRASAASRSDQSRWVAVARESSVASFVHELDSMFSDPNCSSRSNDWSRAVKEAVSPLDLFHRLRLLMDDASDSRSRGREEILKALSKTKMQGAIVDLMKVPVDGELSEWEKVLRSHHDAANLISSEAPLSEGLRSSHVGRRQAPIIERGHTETSWVDRPPPRAAHLTIDQPLDFDAALAAMTAVAEQMAEPRPGVCSFEVSGLSSGDANTVTREVIQAMSTHHASEDSRAQLIAALRNPKFENPAGGPRLVYNLKEIWPWMGWSSPPPPLKGPHKIGPASLHGVDCLICSDPTKGLGISKFCTLEEAKACNFADCRVYHQCWRCSKLEEVVRAEGARRGAPPSEVEGLLQPVSLASLGM